MKKYLVLVMTLLLILVPFSTRAEEDDEVMIYYDEEYEDVYDDEYEDDNDVEYYIEDYYDEDDSSDYDTVIMEADETLDLDNTAGTNCEKKLFTANNIIFLAVGVVTGAALVIVAVVSTRGRCKCCCECDNKEKEEKKKAKKNDK